MKISIGNDHAGTQYKDEIISFLRSRDHEVINHGTNTKKLY
jgi:ribose 5-phosphate isomerase B